MNRCPISYEFCGAEPYSKVGLKRFSSQLNRLNPLPYTAQEQRQEAVLRVRKISIQGVQPKLSAKLAVKMERFILVNKKGNYIIKPQSDIYNQLPENEDLTMKMASLVGIEVPTTGLIYSKDGSFSYVIKRFDRYGRGKKYHQEDFSQLTGNTRDTKYNWSMEKLVPVLDYCTFPRIERQKLFRRVLFCFLTGNEDMHLKNFSLIYRKNKIELSPCYDLLNTSIVLKDPVEELALPLAGKKSKFTKEHFVDYFGKERLELNRPIIDKELNNLRQKTESLFELIRISFLNDPLKKNYTKLMQERFERLGI